jgi:hypothetical protein
MSNNFLETSGGFNSEDLLNGTANLNINSIKIQGLTQTDKPVKTDPDKQLITTNIDIDDVFNLQSTLDSKISNPFIGKLEVSDLETDDYFSLNTELQKIDNFTASTQAPDVTNITGLTNSDELAANRLYDPAQTTFIELDGTDVNVSATDLTLNGNSVLTTASPINNTLQNSYDDSTPALIITDDTNGEVVMQRGTTGGDSDVVFAVADGGGNKNFNVKGTGEIEVSGRIEFDGVTDLGLIAQLGVINLKNPTNDVVIQSDSNEVIINAGTSILLNKTTDVDLEATGTFKVSSGGTDYFNIDQATENITMDNDNGAYLNLSGNVISSEGLILHKLSSSGSFKVTNFSNTFDYFKVDDSIGRITGQLSAEMRQVRPQTDDSYDLGAPTIPYRWRNLYLSNNIDNDNGGVIDLSAADTIDLQAVNVQINGSQIDDLIKKVNSSNYVLDGSGGSITTATNNYLFGNNSGSTLSTAINNIFVGSNTGNSLNTNSNIGIGNSCLSNASTGTLNNVIGTSGFSALTIGTNNVGFGHGVGSTITTSSNNVLIGSLADVDTSGIGNGIGIGSNVNIDVSRHCVIGRETGNTITSIKTGADSDCDLGTTTRKFKNLYLSNTINNNNGSVIDLSTAATIDLQATNILINGSNIETDISNLEDKTQNIDLTGTDGTKTQFNNKVTYGTSLQGDIENTGGNLKVRGDGDLQLEATNGTIRLNNGLATGLTIVDGNDFSVDTTLGSTFTAAIKPSIDNTVDIGTTSLRWKDLYLSNNIDNNDGSVIDLSTTDTIDLQATNILINGNSITKSYGLQYFINNATTTTIVTQNVYVDIAGVRVVGGIVNEFTSNTSDLEYTGTGTKIFKVEYNGEWEAGGASSNAYVLGFHKNGTLITEGQVRGKLDNTNANYPRNVSTSTFVSLATNDTITIKIKNLDGTQNVLVQDMSINIIQID